MKTAAKSSQGASYDATEKPVRVRKGLRRLSEFRADRWHYAPDVADACEPPPLYWTFQRPSEAKLPAKDWPALIDQGRWFVASLEIPSPGSKPLKFGTIQSIHSRLRYLLIWMANAGYGSLSKLEPDVAETYLDHLAREKVSGEDIDDEDALTQDTIAGYVEVLCRMHRKRHFLEAHCSESAVMERHPFGGRTAYEVAGAVARKGDGWIEPVPDDVWVPTVRAATEWLDRNARNVALLGEILAATLRDHPDPYNLPHDLRLRQAVLASDLDGSIAEWLEMVPLRTRRWAFRDEDLQDRTQDFVGLYRSLLDDLRDAGTIVVQAMVGLRIGEMVGLNAGIDTGGSRWPDCLEVVRSRSELDEVFHIRGRVFKLRDDPEEVTWVAGTRPAGSSHTPATAKAVLALEAAFRPWRRLGEKQALIVSLGPEALPRIRSDVVPIRASMLARGQLRFMRAHADLPEHRQGWRLCSHQWRKSFAINVVRADARLLAGLSDHFKHLSIEMTERGYVGRDPTLLGLVNDMGVREAARTLFEAATGTTILTGRMAGVVTANAGNIKRLGGTGPVEQRIERIEDALRQDDIRVWPSDWGQCLFRPETSMCHHGRKPEDLVPRTPDYLHRHPGVCCDCANLLVTDRHAGFWRDRMISNLAAAGGMDREGETAAADRARERARKASVHLDRQVKAASAKELEA